MNKFVKGMLLTILLGILLLPIVMFMRPSVIPSIAAIAGNSIIVVVCAIVCTMILYSIWEIIRTIIELFRNDKT